MLVEEEDAELLSVLWEPEFSADSDTEEELVCGLLLPVAPLDGEVVWVVPPPVVFPEGCEVAGSEEELSEEELDEEVELSSGTGF